MSGNHPIFIYVFLWYSYFCTLHFYGVKAYFRWRDIQHGIYTNKLLRGFILRGAFLCRECNTVHPSTLMIDRIFCQAEMSCKFTFILFCVTATLEILFVWILNLSTKNKIFHLTLWYILGGGIKRESSCFHLVFNSINALWQCPDPSQVCGTPFSHIYQFTYIFWEVSHCEEQNKMQINWSLLK